MGNGIMMELGTENDGDRGGEKDVRKKKVETKMREG